MGSSYIIKEVLDGASILFLCVSEWVE